MNPIHRLLVVATLVCAAPALADLVIPAPTPPQTSPEGTAPAEDEPKDAPVAEPRDAPITEPRQPVPPPVDEELMKTLPPPSLGATELIGPLAKTMLMLCVVLALVYLTLHKGLGKLVERQNMGKRVKVVERVNLDPRRALFLVELDGKQMLLAAGEGGVVHLKDLDPVDARAPSSSSAGSSGGSGLGARFAEALKSKMPGAQPPVTTGLSRDDATVAASKAGGAT